jgi:hypothetical protein
VRDNDRDKWLRLPWPLVWQPNKDCKLVFDHGVVVLYCMQMNKIIKVFYIEFCADVWMSMC